MPRPNRALLEHRDALFDFFIAVEQMVFPKINDDVATQRRSLGDALLVDANSEQIIKWKRRSDDDPDRRAVERDVGAYTDPTPSLSHDGGRRHRSAKARGLALLATILQKDPRFMRRDWERWRKGDVFPTLDEFLSLYEAVCLIGWTDPMYRRTDALRKLHEFVQVQVQARDRELLRLAEPFLRISAATLLQAARAVNVNHNKALPIVINSFFKHVLELDQFRMTPESIRAVKETFERTLHDMDVAARSRIGKQYASDAHAQMTALAADVNKKPRDDD